MDFESNCNVYIIKWDFDIEVKIMNTFIWIYSVFRWGATQSVWAGNYLIAITSKLLAQTRNDDVVRVFAQVLKDLVTGNWFLIWNHINLIEL